MRRSTGRSTRRNARGPELQPAFDPECTVERMAEFTADPTTGPTVGRKVGRTAERATERTAELAADLVDADLVPAPAAGRGVLRRVLGFGLGLVLVLGAVTLGAVTLGNTIVASVSPPHSASIPIPASTPEAIPPPPLPTHSAPAGLPHQEPVRVTVPRVGIDAKVTKVDLNTDGTLKVPPDNTVTGWYSKGPAPGDAGGPPAVIAGHVDSRAGPAVFFSLRQGRPKDKVIVQRADGSTAVFVVYRVAQFPKTKFPAEQVYAPGPRAELRLITCSGTFDYDARSYLSDFVAYAALQPPPSPSPKPSASAAAEAPVQAAAKPAANPKVEPAAVAGSGKSVGALARRPE